MAVEFVRFLKGTPEAFEKLTQKDYGTLYFVVEKDVPNGKLYLGDKLISSSLENNTLENLFNISKEDLKNNDLIVYDLENDKWINKDLSSLLTPIIDVMKGARRCRDGTSGLVPLPTTADVNKFLKGDGTWSSYTFTEEDYQNIVNYLNLDMYWEEF